MCKYDWCLRYGENQECIMRSGKVFPTEESARKNGEDFIKEVNRLYNHYPNPKIEVVKL